MYARIILVVTVLTWAGLRSAAGQGEKEAVASIEKIGGKVQRASAEPGSSVIGVIIHQKTIAGEDLRHFAALKDLEYVIFFTVTIKGEGLKHLKGLEKLHTLSLGFTNLSSEKTWDDLKELKQLKEIGVGYTTIAGEREPRTKLRQALPQVKFIGPLLLGPRSKDAKKESTFQGIAMTKWVAQLASSDLKVRLEAVTRFREIGPAGGPIVPTLATILKDPEPDVRRAIAEVLAIIGPEAKEAVPALAAALNDPNKDVRFAVATALPQIDPGNLTPIKVLTDSLAAEGKYTRTRAAAALLRVDPENKAALDSFTALLADNDQFVSSGAAIALKKIGPRARNAVPTLLKALEHPNPDTRANAAASLGEIGPVTDAVVPALIAALKPPVPDPKKGFLFDASIVRERAAEALGKFGPKAKTAVPELTTALKNPQSLVRLKAASALLQIDPKNKDVPAVVVELVQNHGNIFGLVEVVGKVDPTVFKDTVPTLNGRLFSPDDRVQAIRLLGAIGPIAKDAIPVITPGLTIPGHPNQEYALALARIDPGKMDYVTLLTRDLEKANWNIRRWGVKYLRRLGSDGRAAVPALTAALEDADLQVRWEAAEALRAIDPEAAKKAGLKVR